MRGAARSNVERLIAWSALAFACAATACETPGAPTAPTTPATSDEPPVPFAQRFAPNGAYRLDAAVPPAYRRDVGYRALKGDQFDNTRVGAPENYTITAPPADITNVRPMTEWEEMSALVIAYPSYAMAQEQASDTFVKITKYASDHGQVWILVDGQQSETVFRAKLAREGIADAKYGTDIKFLRANLETYWFIDYGPLPLIDDVLETYSFADFRYYHRRPHDDAVPTVLGRATTRLGELFPATTYRVPLTTEGGTFQATRDGVCFTGSRQIYHMSCLDGGCDESIKVQSLESLQTQPYAVEMRGLLGAYVGCKDLVVTHSISDDLTGHIDMYLKVLADDRILLGDYRAPFDSATGEDNARLMDDNAAFLEAYIKPDGGRFQVARLPMPGHRPVQDWWGNVTEVPFTYINSTFFNGLNLWPAYTFGDWKDSRAEAEAIWEEVLPDMAHVWIDAEELSYSSGAIHCVTRTIPAKKAHEWVRAGTCSEGVCGGAEGGYEGACALAGATDLCWGPQWMCGCNDCRECPEVVPDSACRNVTWRGCCDAGDVLFCESSRLQRLPCAGTGCGWDAGQGYYTCGVGGEDPTGGAPVSCACEPSCAGKTCDDDGCGGSCGTCEADSQCVAGSCRDDCEACTPDATGCDGPTAWRCVAGPEGCNALARDDCAIDGMTCDEGGCVAVAVADPEPDGARDHDAVGVLDGTAANAPDLTDGNHAAETAARGSGVRDDGCAGGAIPGWALAIVGLARLARQRRFAGAAARRRA